MIALVEQPMAIATLIAFSYAARVWIFDGVKSSHTICTMRRPESAAMRMWLESSAGMDDDPGRLMPIDSMIAVMVLAVPIVMQVPWLRAMPPSTPSQSALVILPARRSSQYFHESDPEPRIVPL